MTTSLLDPSTLCRVVLEFCQLPVSLAEQAVTTFDVDSLRNSEIAIIGHMSKPQLTPQNNPLTTYSIAYSTRMIFSMTIRYLTLNPKQTNCTPFSNFNSTYHHSLKIIIIQDSPHLYSCTYTVKLNELLKNYAVHIGQPNYLNELSNPIPAC